MSAKIIDGKQIAFETRREIKEKTEKLKKNNIIPGLAVVLVGDDHASQIYVRNKEKACREVGIHSVNHKLPESTSQQELLELIERLNNDDSIHGILVQLPVPEHIETETVIKAISPEKDVDGFHPINVGNLMLGYEGFKPCTPHGCMVLLDKAGVSIEGKKAVVVGRSDIVGKPISIMLLQRNATVTMCHSRTKNLEEEMKQGDILIAAAGKPELVTGDAVKAGAAVIDVGINRRDDGSLVGDVHFDSVSQVAGWLTPVPKGVGPMTITMLLHNTLEAAEKSC